MKDNKLQKSRKSMVLIGYIQSVILILCSMLFSVFFQVGAANTATTVYQRKHVCILYDDSGSMNFDPRWSYASYAAQTFAGLLNDTDTLTVYRMKQGPIEVNLQANGDRASEVNKIRKGTMNPTGNTPSDSIYAARNVLVEEGLKSDSEMSSPDGLSGDQFWLVLTTDGVFDDEKMPDVDDEEKRIQQTKQIQMELLSHLTNVVDGFSNLHLVYFGIGSEGEKNPKRRAVDFSSMLKSDDARISKLAKNLYDSPNFTALFATSPEKIVETMHQLSTQIAGRYEVTNDVDVSGNTVTLNIGSESSPIRNIAILAQNTNAELLEAIAEDGVKLAVTQKTRLEYPRRKKLKNIENESPGGCTALVRVDSEEEARIPPGEVILKFSEPVSVKDLSLMYEPAIYLSAIIKKQDDKGDWIEVPEREVLPAGSVIQITYQIYELGTGRELNVKELFGETKSLITVNGEVVKEGQNYELPEGNSLVTVDLTMMDGGYHLSQSRQLETFVPPSPPVAEDFEVSSSGPLEFTRHELAENTEKAIEFTVTYSGVPADIDLLERIEADLPFKGEKSVETGVIRFVPRDEVNEGTYSLILRYENEEIAAEAVTVKKDIRYEAEPSPDISVMDNEIDSNNASAWFSITAHTDEGIRPITDEEAELFRIEISNAGGENAGHLITEDTFQDGILIQAIQSESDVGDYTISLFYLDTSIAEVHVSIVEHDVVYTVAAFPSDPNVVDRIFPEKKNAQVAFVLTADGKECSNERLQALLGSSVIMTGNPKNTGLPVKLKIGEYKNQPAIIAAPEMKARNPITRLIYRISAAWNSVSLGEWDLTLKVDLPKGSEATGALFITDSLFWRTFYRVLPFVILLVFVLILMFIISNLRMLRLPPGTLEYYCLKRTRNKNEYECLYCANQSMTVPQGVFFRLTPAPQVIKDFHGKRFEAGTLVPKVTGLGILRFGRAKVSWEDDGDILDYYYQQDGMRVTDDAGHYVVDRGIFTKSIDYNLSWAQIEEHSDNESSKGLLRAKIRKKSKISSAGGGRHVIQKDENKDIQVHVERESGVRHSTMLGIGNFLIHRIYSGKDANERRYPETIEIWCHLPIEKQSDKRMFQKPLSVKKKTEKKTIKKL